LVERVTTPLTADKLTLRVVPKQRGADLALECWGATRKGKVPGELLGREMVVLPATLA
jgi:hypothetical protein